MNFIVFDFSIYFIEKIIFMFSFIKANISMNFKYLRHTFTSNGLQRLFVIFHAILKICNGFLDI